MIQIKKISNLKLIHDTRKDEVVILEDIPSEEDGAPVFVADSITPQEKYLIKKYLNSLEGVELYKTSLNDVNELQKKTFEENEKKFFELIEIVNNLKEVIGDLKSENFALSAELADLRRSKIEEAKK